MPVGTEYCGPHREVAAAGREHASADVWRGPWGKLKIAPYCGGGGHASGVPPESPIKKLLIFFCQSSTDAFS